MDHPGFLASLVLLSSLCDLCSLGAISEFNAVSFSCLYKACFRFLFLGKAPHSRNRKGNKGWHRKTKGMRALLKPQITIIILRCNVNLIFVLNKIEKFYYHRLLCLIITHHSYYRVLGFNISTLQQK